MNAGDRITRGILIGGAIGAFCVLFGFMESMFIGVGMGAGAGFLAGLTHAFLDKNRKK